MFVLIEKAHQKVLKGICVASNQEDINIGIKMNLLAASKCANNLKNVDVENIKWIGN